jgi:hypothetical protein
VITGEATVIISGTAGEEDGGSDLKTGLVPDRFPAQADLLILNQGQQAVRDMNPGIFLRKTIFQQPPYLGAFIKIFYRRILKEGILPFLWEGLN